MKTKRLCFILAACLIQGIVSGQDGDVTEIPSEGDIQPLLETKNVDDAIEGSGDPSIDDNIEITTQEAIPKLEHIMPLDVNENEQDTNNSSSPLPCPKPCVCSIEGDKNKFVVDCSGYSLTEFPWPLDSRITTLNLNNNKLTEIPKEISTLKELEVLNADDNAIMELAAGSVSELPALVKLKLANNRLIEFPQDLKNSLSVMKLEELDLGGNDIRTKFTPELFSNLKSLRQLTLPFTASDLSEDLCKSLKETLESVCYESCKKKIFECPDAPESIGDDLFDATLPGMIAFQPDDIQKSLNTESNSSNTTPSTEATTAPTPQTSAASSVSESTSSVTEFSLRNAVNQQPIDNVPLNSIVEAPTETSQADSEVKIGAKTAESKSGGGVDKSVIGIIIAAMVVIVAVITIKKNWSSIKKKFGSTPRTNERTTVNGTSPEEVPLQEKANDKSPV
ncbi:unnamed protein product [Colias eurytheme]|nr:unnamed protein product [Colias eurytheme]